MSESSVAASRERRSASTEPLNTESVPAKGDEHGAAARAQSAEMVQLYRGGAGALDAGAVQQSAQRGLRSPGGTLPHLDEIQAAFGPQHDLSNIQAHMGETSTAACESMGAEAYATGDRVAFRGSPSRRLAAHEAAHVVQQRAGATVPGGVGRAGDSLEKHADAVADRVVAGRSAADLLSGLDSSGGASESIQKKETRGELVNENLQMPTFEEGEALGGHPITHHGPQIKLSDLRKRVEGTHPSMPQSRTALKFPSETTMKEAQKAVWRSHGKAIKDHFAAGGGQMAIPTAAGSNLTVGSNIGVGFTNTGTRNAPVSKPVPLDQVSKVKLILRPHSSATLGYYIHTFFPGWP